MTQQICPNCRQANSLDNQFCARCGQSLSPYVLGPRRDTAMTVGSGRLLPGPTMKQVGQAVAVSLVALAAEASVAWLRRRVRQMSAPPPAQTAVVPRPGKSQPKTVVSQRTVQVWQNGRLTGQLEEQSVWQEGEPQ